MQLNCFSPDIKKTLLAKLPGEPRLPPSQTNHSLKEGYYQRRPRSEEASREINNTLNRMKMRRQFIIFVGHSQSSTKKNLVYLNAFIMKGNINN
jgi:hypothetical protein